MKQVLLRFLRAEEGVTLIEYGLVITLISLAIVVSASVLGSRLNSNYLVRVGSALN